MNTKQRRPPPWLRSGVLYCILMEPALLCRGWEGLICCPTAARRFPLCYTRYRKQSGNQSGCCRGSWRQIANSASEVFDTLKDHCDELYSCLHGQLKHANVLYYVSSVLTVQENSMLFSLRWLFNVNEHRQWSHFSVVLYHWFFFSELSFCTFLKVQMWRKHSVINILIHTNWLGQIQSYTSIFSLLHLCLVNQYRKKVLKLSWQTFHLLFLYMPCKYSSWTTKVNWNGESVLFLLKSISLSAYWCCGETWYSAFKKESISFSMLTPKYILLTFFFFKLSSVLWYAE